MLTPNGSNAGVLSRFWHGGWAEFETHYQDVVAPKRFRNVPHAPQYSEMLGRQFLNSRAEWSWPLDSGPTTARRTRITKCG